MTDRLMARNINAKPVPASGARTVWDSEVRGLGVRIYAGGTRSFFFNYRIDGVERRKTIGRLGDWSVEAARIEAKELRKQVDRGEDPARKKRERREAATIADLIERYERDHLPTKSQSKMRLNDEKRQLDMIGKALGMSTRVEVIHGGDIQEMQNRITENRGPVRANRVLALCSKMFSMALVPLAGEDSPWRNALQGNPCKGIARNREEGRERYFSESELERIAAALAEYPPEAYEKQKKPGQAAVDALRLMMLTGCRPSEAMKAEWPEFDAAPGFWIKPSSHTKQKKIHRLPLSPPAVELIERLRKDRTTTKWVFPGKEPGEFISTFTHCWGFVRERAALASDEQGRPARPYDLRHSFASIAAGSNFGLPIIGKLLGRSSARTTQRYAHLADNPLKVAADRIGTTIANAGKSGADVVPITKAAHGG